MTQAPHPRGPSLDQNWINRPSPHPENARDSAPYPQRFPALTTQSHFRDLNPGPMLYENTTGAIRIALSHKTLRHSLGSRDASQTYPARHHEGRGNWIKVIQLGQATRRPSRPHGLLASDGARPDARHAVEFPLEFNQPHRAAFFLIDLRGRLRLRAIRQGQRRDHAHAPRLFIEKTTGKT